MSVGFVMNVDFNLKKAKRGKRKIEKLKGIEKNKYEFKVINNGIPKKFVGF